MPLNTSTSLNERIEKLKTQLTQTTTNLESKNKEITSLNTKLTQELNRTNSLR